MKTIIFAAAALAGAPAFAQVNPPAPPPAPQQPQAGSPSNGLYLAIGFEGLRIDEDPFFINPAWGAVQGRVGYNFNKYFGFEGQASLGLYPYAFDDDGENYESEDPDLNYSLAAFVVPRIPLSSTMSIYGRVGYMSAEYEYDNGIVTTADGPAFGAGFDVAIGRTMSFYIDYTFAQLSNTDTLGNVTNDYDASGTSLTIGVLNRF